MSILLSVVRHRLLGRTGLEVSELALGTWGLSGEGYGPVSDSEQDRVIERARTLGIILFETASSYGQGAMEERLGRILSSDRSVTFVTKLGTCLELRPPRKRFDRSFLLESFERSCQRLRREPLDVVLLHNPSLLAVEQGEATTVLEELEAAGRLRTWGVSAGSAEVARAALARGARVLSLAYNLLFSRDLVEVYAQVKAQQAGLLAHSVLAYGLLAGLWSQDRLFEPGDHRRERWSENALRKRLRQLDALRPLARGMGMTMRGMALRYVLAEPLVSAAVLGPRSTLQLDQLVREAGQGPPYLPESMLIGMKSRLRNLGLEA